MARISVNGLNSMYGGMSYSSKKGLTNFEFVVVDPSRFFVKNLKLTALAWKHVQAFGICPPWQIWPVWDTTSAKRRFLQQCKPT